MGGSQAGVRYQIALEKEAQRSLAKGIDKDIVERIVLSVRFLLLLLGFCCLLACDTNEYDSEDDLLYPAAPIIDIKNFPSDNGVLGFIIVAREIVPYSVVVEFAFKAESDSEHASGSDLVVIEKGDSVVKHEIGTKKEWKEHGVKKITIEIQPWSGTWSGGRYPYNVGKSKITFKL